MISRLGLACFLPFGLCATFVALAQTDSRDFGPGGGMSYNPDPLPICFPPFPPPLGRPIPRGIPQVPSRITPPPELTGYVNEIFYPQLSTRLLRNELGAKQRQQLNDYRAAKLALQNELRAELDRVAPLDADARRAALEGLARRQTPKIAALEQTAEQLRKDLRVTGGDWSELREWHLSDRSDRGYSPIEIAMVLRGYAHYQDGLLPAQRRLLREIAIEMLNAEESTDKATAAQPYVFFPPEPARVMLPDNIPPELDAKIAAFQTRKSRLKKELFDAISQQDGGGLAIFHRPIRELADKQAKPLLELDALAEEIRRGLALLPAKTTATEPSPLPATIAARIGAVIRNRAAAQHEAATKVDAILARHAADPIRVSYRFEEDTLRFVVIPSVGRGRGMPSKSDLASTEATRAEIAAVAEDYARRCVELANEREAIRQDAATALGTKNPEALSVAMNVANRIAVQQDNEDAYRDYRTAVFEPGLSPEQRRLLFDAALERLELPLPRGERQPTRRSPTW